MSATNAPELWTKSPAKAVAASRPTLISKSPFTNLWRALTAPNETLDAHEAASTLFRFFRSDHVIDLRLIALATGIVFVFHISIAVLFGLVVGFSHVVAPIAHAFGISSPFLHSVVNDSAALASFLGTYLTLFVTVYSAILAWAYLSAAKRLGVVDLFACEISTVCRVGTLFHTATRNIERYKKAKKLEQSANKHLAKRDGAEKHAAKERAVEEPSNRSESFVSHEDYFPIFANNSSDLQSLEALVVVNITEFYTYMKAARDLLRKAGEIQPSQTATTIADLIYVVFLAYESARQSIKHLVEFEPTRAEDTIVILLTELKSYSFLRKHCKRDQTKSARLELRENDYRGEIPKLYRTVNSPHGDENRVFWERAEKTTIALAKLYKETFHEDMLAALDRIRQQEKGQLEKEQLEQRPRNRKQRFFQLLQSRS